MARYQLSRRAATDLEAIAEYTIERFGIEQARRYPDELSACFDQLGNDPGVGRPVEFLGAGIRRFEHRSHIIFYQAVAAKIFVVRVLHYRMYVRRHVQDHQQ